MKRNSKYLVCKWGSGKRNDSAAKYILWILSWESQKIWVGSLFSVRIPTAVHAMMDCGCKYDCGQSGKEKRWALPIGVEQIQWARHHLHNELGLRFPCGQGESALASTYCRAGSFLPPLRHLLEHKELDYINLCAHAREEERLSFFFFPAAQVQWHPCPGVLAWLD